MAKKPTVPKTVETLTHEEARRRNIPTAEYQSVMRKEEQNPIRIAYERRNRDLDPQLAWRGKDEQDWSDLVVHAPPLYIQEKVHPKSLIDDLLRRTEADDPSAEAQLDLFNDFNGLPDDNAKTEFYQHDANWSNRMILGDSLQVMASLAEREGLQGKVQCIYLDPPYGIKFNSNFQWSTTSRDVKDGNVDHITREPEQVKAFRDTWRDGIHSYLTYLRDRLTVCRDLLMDLGSIFVQIGDENVHRVRGLMDEVFGAGNFVSLVTFAKTTGQTDNLLASVTDYVLWYAKQIDSIKYRQPYKIKALGGEGALAYTRAVDDGGARVTAAEAERSGDLSRFRFYTTSDLTSQSPGTRYKVEYCGKNFFPKGYWKTEESSFPRLIKANRIEQVGRGLRYIRYFDDYPAFPISNLWSDTGIAGFAADKIYIVQTTPKVVERCLLMTTDPGDLVLDPTCGSGTTAYVAEQWGRRWITIDTSRVALALARAPGLRPQPRYGEEIKALGCRLAIFVPYGTAVGLLQQLMGVSLAPGTLWNWTQRLGQRLVQAMEADLPALEVGDCRGQESVPAALKGQPLVIGADGVMVPFRPQPGSPKGKTRWGEVKVAIVARLGRWVNRRRKVVTRRVLRRLVAVHDGLPALQARLWLEALRQHMCRVRQVLWLSDGGRGFWNLFERCFKRLGVIGILDFYQAAQYLYKGAKAAFDGRTQRCQACFKRWRHNRRHGRQSSVLAEIQSLVASKCLPKEALSTLTKLQNYLEVHQDHLDYAHFKAQGLPLGSGLVESACKWLIQQRFKGVGMRWSETGFDHLLHLRLAWVNQRLDRILPTLHPSPKC